MNILSVWESLQGDIKNKIGSTSYETWFSALHIKEKNSQTLLIEAPDEFFKNWIIEHYQHTLYDLLKSASSTPISIDFQVNPTLLQEKTQSRLSAIEKNFEDIDKNRPNLNSRFTFENFIIGPSNRFAHAACLAVAESPAKSYNPLFIYGDVGLGKTHLMQAIAHHVQKRNGLGKCCYVSSEKFTNELIDAIRHRATAQYRQKYRNIDVLLIDDIHFIAGKESTQEEFFHTFNALHDNRKQIIISSDRPPKNIPNLEERLRSRFSWGLIADIQPPDFETRVAILRKKLEQESVLVPTDVLFFIAQEIKTNIRELEGALIRVIAYSVLEEKPITLEVSKTILKDVLKENAKTITVDLIIKDVSEYFQVTAIDIKATKRSKTVVYPRQIAMYLARELTSLSLPEIGAAFGGKDHTTVLHSWNKIHQELTQNKNLKNEIDQLFSIIKK